jgi:hypothetical protein
MLIHIKFNIFKFIIGTVLYGLELQDFFENHGQWCITGKMIGGKARAEIIDKMEPEPAKNRLARQHSLSPSYTDIFFLVARSLTVLRDLSWRKIR